MRRLRALLFGVPAIVLLALALFALTPCIARCGDATEALTETLRACPRAVQLLGDGAEPARLGLACGTTESGGGYSRSSWSLPYSGSRARGDVNYAGEKRAGVWRFDEATLEVDGETIDLLACTASARVAKAPKQLAQTNADAATAKFDGKVIRSTHATIQQGNVCRGELARERGSPFAKVKVDCGAEANAIYDGTGNFTLDVGDPTRREDDRSEFDDSKTSDADKTPGCRLSSSANKGTLTIWDAGYEIVVEL